MDESRGGDMPGGNAASGEAGHRPGGFAGFAGSPDHCSAPDCYGPTDGGGGGGPDSGGPSEGGAGGQAGGADETGGVAGGAAEDECAWYVPFDSISELPGPFNGTPPSESFWLSSDGLTAYFNRKVSSKNFDIFVSTRETTMMSFNGATLLFEPSTLEWERQMNLSRGQLQLVYQDASDIFLSERASIEEPFVQGKRLPEPVNGTVHDVEPCLQSDGRGLYFSSERTGANDLYFVALEAGQPVGQAMPLEGLNTSNYDGAPVVSVDGLTLYYQSGAQEDIWVAHRESVDATFEEKRALSEINTAQGEFPESISDDGCTLYFMGWKVDRLVVYRATRQP